MDVSASAKLVPRTDRYSNWYRSPRKVRLPTPTYIESRPSVQYRTVLFQKSHYKRPLFSSARRHCPQSLYRAQTFPAKSSESVSDPTSLKSCFASGATHMHELDTSVISDVRWRQRHKYRCHPNSSGDTLTNAMRFSWVMTNETEIEPQETLLGEFVKIRVLLWQSTTWLTRPFQLSIGKRYCIEIFGN